MAATNGRQGRQRERQYGKEDDEIEETARRRYEGGGRGNDARDRERETERDQASERKRGCNSLEDI
jgi:hypothetical protein